MGELLRQAHGQAYASRIMVYHHEMVGEQGRAPVPVDELGHRPHSTAGSQAKKGRRSAPHSVASGQSGVAGEILEPVIETVDGFAGIGTLVDPSAL